jgi:hypothetical protein
VTQFVTQFAGCPVDSVCRLPGCRQVQCTSARSRNFAPFTSLLPLPPRLSKTFGSWRARQGKARQGKARQAYKRDPLPWRARQAYTRDRGEMNELVRNCTSKRVCQHYVVQAHTTQTELNTTQTESKATCKERAT